ncbi:Aim3p [Saccharomyces paradoxus]|uniref:Altered inheritance of mitochondria protein 3 n=1 Tax=Saccharomyces paradoxus TaxID=27291 RepID=A0A8B8ULR3_SACPA|nr:Aim3 [Saccharomyces paradoxus]QHS71670.1 Aim3 [Saccharomyces paradoxus]
MGFWENNKDSITSGLKSAGKYGYQGTKYVAKTGYKASKKHYNNSKSRREKKNGKKNTSDEEYESEDEEEYERKPTNIRTLKDPNSFPPPPLKPEQKTYSGQHSQQQMPNGQAGYAFQGAYQGQPGAESIGQQQYAQQQYMQYPQQQQQQGLMPQQTPIYGEQVPPYGSNSNTTSYQSLPQQNQPQNAMPSQVSLNSASQQSTGFPSQNLQYGAQLGYTASPLPSQNNLQSQQQPQQPQYESHGPPNLGQSQFPSGPQQQPATQFGQQVLPAPAQPQQQQQGQPFPPPRGQPILPTPGQFLSNGSDQQQQQQQQPLNQNCAPLPQLNVGGVQGMATGQPLYGQPLPNATNVQDSNAGYGASPIQGQPLVGGQPPVPARMQPQPPQPMQAGNIYQTEPSFDSTGSTPHFEVTPFDPDAPVPKPKIDIPIVDVNSLPPPPTHRDRGAVIKQEPAPSSGNLPAASGKTPSNAVSSSPASLPLKHSRPITTDSELNSENRETDEDTAKSSILGHYDVDVNLVPPPKPFRRGPDSASSGHTRKAAPEQKVPSLPPRNNVEPPPPPSRGKPETTESMLSTNSAKAQEDPISNFLPPPKPFRHTETKQNQDAAPSLVEKKNDVLPGSPSKEGKNIEPSSLPQPKSQSQTQPRRAHMETQPIENFQPPPKPFRRSPSSNFNDDSHNIDGTEANHGRGRGRIAKHGDGDQYDSKSGNSTENDRLDHDVNAPNSFIGKRAPTPPAPPRSEKLRGAAITSEVESLKGANNYRKSSPPPSSPMQAPQSTKKVPPPVVKPKPKNFSLKANEPPRELTRKTTTDSLQRSGQGEALDSITNELSHFKLRKTNVNLEELGGSKTLKDSSPIPSDLDEKYVSASGSITPPRPPPSRSSAKKVPPVVPRKNDNLKKKPPVVPKKKPLLKSLEPRPIEMESGYSRDNYDGDDNLNPFERYKRNVVPQEEDRLHK